MTEMFHKLLLSELHMVTYQPGNPAGITDDLICQSVTLNENLRSFGFVLRPDDIIRLAASSSLHEFFNDFRRLIPDIKAKPMYPGFPQQVMEMSEAEFRLHQWIHYFTTYGMESLLGKEVSRGWLPDYNGPERYQDDTELLESKVIELVSEQEASLAVLKTLLSRRERLTNPELALILECAPLCSAEQMKGLKIRFKENLDLLFPLLMGIQDRKTARRTLRCICAHAGDVLRCTKDYLSSKKYHLTTSEKKLLVSLLESYPVRNFEANLIQSQSLRERNLLVLKHLDYNRFARSPEHREKVRALRNKELLSWHGVGEVLMRSKKPEALDHLAQRPGYMVRMINRLLSLDYSKEDILDVLRPKAGVISGHLIFQTVNALARKQSCLEHNYQLAVDECNSRYYAARPPFPLLEHKLEALKETVDRKSAKALKRWITNPQEKATEDACRVLYDMEEEKYQKMQEIQTDKRALQWLQGFGKRGKPRLVQNANSCIDSVALYTYALRTTPEKLQVKIQQMENEVTSLEKRQEEVRVVKKAWLEKELLRIEKENTAAYQHELVQIKEWESSEKEVIRNTYSQEVKEHEIRMRNLLRQRDAELAVLKEGYEHDLQMTEFTDQTIQILKSMMTEHYRQAITELKGKKVWLDTEQFDLDHSVLETGSKSEDGGYIRSGIAWKIPDDAKYIRFFVYWDDPRRVDIDLHAGGLTTEGNSLHVGWNSDYRNCGVVHSGDITHSNAAEYIDIDLSAPIQEIYANIDLYSGRTYLKDVQTCYVGMMAVDKISQEVQHYNPKNCFFTHTMTQKARTLFFGYIDVQGRFVRFIGKPDTRGWDSRPEIESAGTLFSLREYLDCVLEGQGAQEVGSPEEADLIITMGKSKDEKGISLVDNNFFLEC